jgi:hypothetical protein
MPEDGARRAPPLSAILSRPVLAVSSQLDSERNPFSELLASVGVLSDARRRLYFPLL